MLFKRDRWALGSRPAGHRLSSWVTPSRKAGVDALLMPRRHDRPATGEISRADTQALCSCRAPEVQRADAPGCLWKESGRALKDVLITELVSLKVLVAK